MFVIGRITKPHGIKGEVRVFPVTDDPARFELLKKICIEFEGSGKPVFLDIERVRISPTLALVKFKGIDSMDAAEDLRGGRIVISDNEALPLGEDEYYMRDLFDMKVFTVEGEDLGVIVDILKTGANDVYVVRPVEGKDILIPAVKQYITSIDVSGRKMIVQLVEGLR